MTGTVKHQRGLDALRAYVPGKPIEEVQREYGVTECVKLASNENPVGVSPKVVAALSHALQSLNYYPDAQGYKLARAIAERLAVPPEQVRLGNGADGLIRELCVSYLEDDDEVIVSQSSFPVYDISAQVMRAHLVKVPLRDLRLDLDGMAAAVTPRTKLIFVCNPNNPTGTMIRADVVERFMRWVPDHALVIFDEAYYEFVDDPYYPDTLHYVREGRKNVLVMRTFSKSHGIAGLRLGFAVADPDVLAPMRRSAESFPVNRLAQIAGEAALEDDEFLRRTVEVNRVGREYLDCEFRRLGLRHPPSQTNFYLVEIGPEAAQVYQMLLRRGIIVRPCTSYDLPNFLRITIGTPEQNERLVRELEGAMQVVAA